MHEKKAEIAKIIEKLRRISQAVHAQSKKAEITTGLTGTQLLAIKIIAESGPIKVTDLAERIHLHPATVVGILDRLETRDLTIRMRSRQDRRVVKIDLTETGRALVSNSPVVTEGLLIEGLEKLPIEQLLNIAASLEQLVNILPERTRLAKHIDLRGSKDLPQKAEATITSSPITLGDEYLPEA